MSAMANKITERFPGDGWCFVLVIRSEAYLANDSNVNTLTRKHVLFTDAVVNKSHLFFSISVTKTLNSIL